MLVKWWCFLSRNFFLFVCFCLRFFRCLFIYLFVCVFVCPVVVYLSNNPFKVKIVFLIKKRTPHIVNICAVSGKAYALTISKRYAEYVVRCRWAQIITKIIMVRHFKARFWLSTKDKTGKLRAQICGARTISLTECAQSKLHYLE